MIGLISLAGRILVTFAMSFTFLVNNNNIRWESCVFFNRSVECVNSYWCHFVCVFQGQSITWSWLRLFSGFPGAFVVHYVFWLYWFCLYWTLRSIDFNVFNILVISVNVSPRKPLGKVQDHFEVCSVFTYIYIHVHVAPSWS